MTTVGESYVLPHVEPASVIDILRRKAGELSVKFFVYKDNDIKPAQEPAISCVPNGNAVYCVVEGHGPDEVRKLVTYLFNDMKAEAIDV